MYSRMGRFKKYTTEEEKCQARRERQMKHYWKHHERLKKENLDRYYQNKDSK